MPGSFVVAIVDDDDSSRQSTADLLTRAGHLADSYAGGAEFLASVVPANPGCLLLAMGMSGLDGPGVMRALRARGAGYPIVALAGHGDVPLAVEAMRLGAVDFLEKPCPPADLLEAIHRVRNAPVAMPGAQPVDQQAQAKVAALSGRQRAVLLGILKGQSSKVIAGEIGLSVRSVEAYRSQMLIKLGAKGAAEAVRMAMAAGLADD